MKAAPFLAAILPCLMLAPATGAASWQADAESAGISDRRIQDCTDTADARKLKGFDREKFIKRCAKGSN